MESVPGPDVLDGRMTVPADLQNMDHRGRPRYRRSFLCQEFLGLERKKERGREGGRERERKRERQRGKELDAIGGQAGQAGHGGQEGLSHACQER